MKMAILLFQVLTAKLAQTLTGFYLSMRMAISFKAILYLTKSSIETETLFPQAQVTGHDLIEMGLSGLSLIEVLHLLALTDLETKFRIELLPFKMKVQTSYGCQV